MGAARQKAYRERNAAYREREKLRERTRCDDSKKTTCVGCGKRCWRSREQTTGKLYPRDHPHRCQECRGPWSRAKAKVLDDRRKARQRDAYVEDVNPEVVYDRDSWRCYLCRKKVNRRLKWPHPRSVSLDHVIPLARGGEHSYANTRCAHLRCNVSKGAYGGGEQLALI